MISIPAPCGTSSFVFRKIFSRMISDTMVRIVVSAVIFSGKYCGPSFRQPSIASRRMSSPSRLRADSGMISRNGYSSAYVLIFSRRSSFRTASVLLITKKTGLFFTAFNFSMIRTSFCDRARSVASHTITITSTSPKVAEADATIYSPSLFFGVWIPGVSIKII